MEPIIQRIEQTTQQNADGEHVPYRQVTWTIGDDGPFVIYCPEESFDPSQITDHIKAEATKIRQLRDAFSH